MRYFFLAFYLLGFFDLLSQPGNYFLSHFSPSDERFDNVCFDIAQTRNGLVYFATRSGVLEFDGRNWNLIPGDGAVYSLQVSHDGLIYWSGAAGYGRIEADEQGFLHIKTFSAPEIKDVFQSLYVSEQLFLITQDKVLVADKYQNDAHIIRATLSTGSFINLVEIFGNVYVNTEGGLYKVENNDLREASNIFSGSEEILFASRYRDQYLIGLANNKILLCDKNLKPTEVQLEDQQYLDASVVISGKWVNEELFALGTLRGGMVFVNAFTGETQEIINYATGLPDNEVYALMADDSQSIWAAHEYGFTRVSPYLPFRSFSHYSGLQGNLLCAISVDNQVYVGTSLGLYALESEEIYEHIAYYVSIAREQPEEAPAMPKQSLPLASAHEPEILPAEPQAEDASKRKGFLRFLKKNRRKEVAREDQPGLDAEESDTTSINEPLATEVPLKGRPRIAYERVAKSDSLLRSAHYVYKKVSGIDAKITELAVAHGHVIAAGLGGAYEVRGQNAEMILDEPSSKVFLSRDQQMLFISTYKNAIRSFQRNEGKWTATTLLDKLDEQVNFVFQGRQNDYWFCGMDKIYHIDIADAQANTFKITPFSNPNFDEIVGMQWGDRVIISNSQGFFGFNSENNTFTAIDSLGKPLQYFARDGNIWFRDAHTWNLLGQEQSKNKLHLLNLFRDLRFVTGGEDPENLWLITGNNELYKFFGNGVTPHEVGYPIILKSIRNANQKISRRGVVQFNQENSAVTFEVVQPDYLASQAIEYRYQLMGLDNSWSDWSTGYNVVDFPYLPAGDYALYIQSRDIFGNTKDLKPILFEVLPPYWKRMWFYALEFILFATLVLLSLRLSTRYRVVSRLLSLLTIILLIQFIQTVVGEVFETRASPVMDFFVQVLVALLILPFESYLRNLLLRSVDPKSMLYRFISPHEEGSGKE